MLKLTSLSLLVICFGLVFAGAVVAAPEVDVSVIDENSTPVTEASLGDQVYVITEVTTDEVLSNPRYVTITPEPTTDVLTFNLAGSEMVYNDDIYSYDPANPFVTLAPGGYAIWDVTWVQDTMLPGERAQLFLPAIISGIGEITVSGDLIEIDGEPIELASGSYTFLSVTPEPSGPEPGPGSVPETVSGATIPLQATGTPITLAILALLGVMGGALYGRFK